MRRGPRPAAHCRRLLALFAGVLLAPAAALGEALRIDDHLPERLSISLETRARYEALFDPFRVGTSRDLDIFVLRTLLHGRLKLTERLTLGAELLDARAYGEDAPVSAGIVNAAELLQAYLDLEVEGPFAGTSRIRGGRITMDLGSRRLVARNRFRNTINGFTGIDWQWTGAEGRVARAFWTLPVQRLPVLPARTADNDVVFDEESLDVQLFGVHFADRLVGDVRGEVFAIGLYEDDSAHLPTRNRRLATPGFRVWQPPRAGRLDFTLESILQFGTSRENVVSREDLDHFAHFHHGEVGYSFDAAMAPRLVAQFDYASGDDDPDDGRNDRFDTLFGARRFDFGPTGIYGPFVRANLVTPGLRLEASPLDSVTGMLALRAFWLANERDAWVGTGLRDRTGGSGSHLGTQIELRLRWDALPGNLRIEGGFAHLFAGGFRDEAPLSNGNGDATYVYVQATLRL